jgi:hypothetical protein
VSVLRGGGGGGWTGLGGGDGAPCVVQLGQPVVQIDTDERGELALLSDTLRTTVLTLPGAKLLQLGTKTREGPYGACFHSLAALAMPGGATAGAAPLLAARPGRRLWLAEASTGEGSSNSGNAAASGAVVRATLRPALGAASVPPGGDAASADADAAGRDGPPFGRLLPAGACCVAVADRALALVDFLGVAVLAWWPLRDAPGPGLAAGAAGVAACGAVVFALGAGVYALTAPSTGEALVRLAAPTDMLRATRLAARFGFVDQELLLEARASFGFAPPDSDAAAVLAEYEAVFARARAAAVAAARAAEEAAAAATSAALFASIQQREASGGAPRAPSGAGGGRASAAGSAATGGPRGGPGSATARSMTSRRGGAASSIDGGDADSDAGSVSGADEDPYLSEASSSGAFFGRSGGPGRSPGVGRTTSGGLARALAGSGDESDGGGGGRGGSAASALKAALLSAIPSVPSFGSLSRQRAPSPAPHRGRTPSPAPVHRMPSPAPGLRRPGHDASGGLMASTSAPSTSFLADAARAGAPAPAPFGIARMPSNSAAGSRTGSVAGGSRPASRAASPARAPSLAASSPAASPAPSPRHGGRGPAPFGRQRDGSGPPPMELPSSPSWTSLQALEGYGGSAEGSAAAAAALAAAREPRGAFVAAAATGAAAEAVYAPKPEAEVLAAAVPDAEEGADDAETVMMPPPAALAAASSSPLMVPLRRARRLRARRRLASGATMEDGEDDGDDVAAAWGEVAPLQRRRSFGGRGGGMLHRNASNASDLTATVSEDGTSVAADGGESGAALSSAAAAALWSPSSAPAGPRGRIGGGAPSAAASASTPALSALLTGASSADSNGGDMQAAPQPPPRARPLFADAPPPSNGDAPRDAPPSSDPAAQLAKAAAAAAAAAQAVLLREADIEGWARLDGIDWPPGDSSSDSDEDSDDDVADDDDVDDADQADLWFPFSRWDAYVDASAGDGDAATALATMAADAEVGRRSARRRRALRRRRWAAAGAGGALRDAVVSLDAAHLVPWLRVWSAARNAHLDAEAEELVASAARRRREGAGAAARAARKRAAPPPRRRIDAAAESDGASASDFFDAASSDGGDGTGSDIDGDGSAAAGGSSRDGSSSSDDADNPSRQPVTALELRRARRLAKLERRLDAALEALGLADDGSDAEAAPPQAPAIDSEDDASSSDGGAFQEPQERFASDAERSPLRPRRSPLRSGGGDEEESAAVVAARPGGVELLADELLYAGDDAGEPHILGRPPGYWHRRARLAQLPSDARSEVLAACFAAALADVDAEPVAAPSPATVAAASAAWDAHAAEIEAAVRDGGPAPAVPALPPFGADVLASPAAATLLRLVDDFAAAAGAAAALAALQRALEAWHAPGGGGRRGRSARTSLDVVALAAADALLAAHAAQLGRDAAAAGLLAPLDAFLWAPPRAALGRAPQLRAVLDRELRGASLADLPFLERRPAPDGCGDGATPDGCAWALGFARGAAEALQPLAEERGHWGVRCRVGPGAKCRRCTMALAGPEPTQLITFPCGAFLAAFFPVCGLTDAGLSRRACVSRAVSAGRGVRRLHAGQLRAAARAAAARQGQACCHGSDQGRAVRHTRLTRVIHGASNASLAVHARALVGRLRAQREAVGHGGRVARAAAHPAEHGRVAQHPLGDDATHRCLLHRNLAARAVRNAGAHGCDHNAGADGHVRRVRGDHQRAATDVDVEALQLVFARDILAGGDQADCIAGVTS